MQKFHFFIDIEMGLKKKLCYSNKVMIKFKKYIHDESYFVHKKKDIIRN